MLFSLTRYYVLYLYNAVGNMFLAIDEPSSRTPKGSNSDLTSIMYKEQLVSNNAKNIAEQSQVVAGRGEDEVRMEVKKEVERINKHSTKQPKPVEGEGPTIACTKRADIIRQEILDLKEESQRLNDKGNECETGGGSEAQQRDEDANKAQIGFEVESDKPLREGEAISQGEHIDQKDVKVDERDVAKDTVNDDIIAKSEMPINDERPEVNAHESDEGFEVEEAPAEGDSGIAIEEYLNLIDANDAGTGIEEYIARMTETTNKLTILESTARKDESLVGITDEAVTAELQNIAHREESGPTKGPPIAAKPSREKGNNCMGITDEATSVEQRDLISKKESGAMKGPPVAAKPPREMGEGCLGIAEEATTEEPRVAMTNEKTNTITEPPIAFENMEESSVEINDETNAESTVDETTAEEAQDPVTRETKRVTDGPPVAAKPPRESPKEIENNEGDKNLERGEETPLTPSGMIPTKHQRMLIDTVLSLDYPSDSESETEDGEEICHYAQIERPSTPDGVLDEESKQQELKDQDEVDEEFDIIICAPPEFCDKDSKHQSLTRIRDHAVLYGATEEGKSVVHHTFVKSHESEKEAGVGASDGVDAHEEGAFLEGAGPSEGKAATMDGMDSIREKEGPEVAASSDTESDSGTEEVVDSSLHIDETRDEVPQPETVVEPAEHGTIEARYPYFLLSKANMLTTTEYGADAAIIFTVNQ